MSSDALKPLQGMKDISAPAIFEWQDMEEQARLVLHTYGFHEVRTPILERTGLFVRSVGDTSDIVQKEMYRFEDRGGREVCLRPEGTASIMRYAASIGQDAQDGRYYYLGPMFRCERPQAGRFRQFHQLGTEVLGEPNPAADAESIALQIQILRKWGISDCTVHVNTRGAADDHAAVHDGLRRALAPLEGELCEDCLRRMQNNVMRVLDCKKPQCTKVVATLPPLRSFMSQPSNDYYDRVIHYLRLLEVEVQQDDQLVRGFDYYLHTVWEIKHTALGAQDALAGGGRYRLTVGKKTLEGVGFALGLERVRMVLQELPPRSETSRSHDGWIVTQHPDAFDENLVLTQTLRLRGLNCGMDLRNRSLKAQMRSANRTGARWVVVRGQQEMESGTFQLKDMATGEQQTVELPELLQRLAQPFELSQE